MRYFIFILLLTLFIPQSTVAKRPPAITVIRDSLAELYPTMSPKTLRLKMLEAARLPQHTRRLQANQLEAVVREKRVFLASPEWGRIHAKMLKRGADQPGHIHALFLEYRTNLRLLDTDPVVRKHFDTNGFNAPYTMAHWDMGSIRPDPLPPVPPAPPTPKPPRSKL